MFNMQSGLKRKSFQMGPTPAAVSQRLGGVLPKYRAVTGLATDALNRAVIASTLDGTINVSRVFPTYIDVC